MDQRLEDLVGLDDAGGRLVLEEQRVSAVGFGPEARLLLDGVVLAVARRTGMLQLFDILHEYEGLEHRPVRRR